MKRFVVGEARNQSTLFPALLEQQQRSAIIVAMAQKGPTGS
ncbi:hypothetical protein [Halomonas sp. KRD171]|nr:hypothetical protein [Halomonas sp. KRD171]